MPSLLVVRDLRFCGPAAATKSFVPLRPSARNFKVLHGWPARNQDGLLRHQVGAQRAQRRNIVNDPNAAAVSGKDKISLARMNHDVAHRSRRKIRSPVLRPALSAIHRNPKSERSSYKKKIRIRRIFFDDVSG